MRVAFAAIALSGCAMSPESFARLSRVENATPKEKSSSMN
jgi:hypothetical protein